MAELNARPMVKVHEFKTTYERRPVKGDVLDDGLDEKGFKLDAKGRRIMENREEDWVRYSPSHSPISTATWERVRDITFTDEMGASEETEKLKFIKARWDDIRPAYEAWKSGQVLPDNGTPLGAWAGVNTEKAEVLRRFGIRSVEDVANLAEGQMEKIPLPGMRDMRRAAIAFLSNRGAAEAAQREADRDNEIAVLKAQLEETNARFSAAMDLLEEAKTGKPAEKPADDVSELRAELDRLGVEYHHKAGAERLRSLLNEAKASA